MKLIVALWMWLDPIMVVSLFAFWDSSPGSHRTVHHCNSSANVLRLARQGSHWELMDYQHHCHHWNCLLAYVLPHLHLHHS